MKIVHELPDQVLDVRLCGVASGPSDQSANVQKAAMQARSLGLALHFGGGFSTVYTFESVDVSGLTVTAGDGVVLTHCGSEYLFLSTGQTKLIGLKSQGTPTAKGLFKATGGIASVENCEAVGYSSAANSNTIFFQGCDRPSAHGNRVEGGENGIVFENCFHPVARANDIEATGRDGILFYTDEAQSQPTSCAVSIGNTIRDFARDGEGGRGGVHFYGVHGGARSIGDSVSNDNSQPHDDTGGIRFRDCENFVCEGYTVSGCRSGVLVNHVGDFTGIAKTSGTIGAGVVDGYAKFGINISGAEIVCPVTGVKITNGEDTASGAAIYHSGVGAITGCVISDAPRYGVHASGENSITGNIFVSAGAMPSVYIDGESIVGGNHFDGDVALRVPSGGTATIAANHYGGATMQLDAGATIGALSQIIYAFGGAPIFPATISPGVTAINSGGAPYAYHSGAWHALT